MGILDSEFKRVGLVILKKVDDHWEPHRFFIHGSWHRYEEAPRDKNGNQRGDDQYIPIDPPHQYRLRAKKDGELWKENGAGEEIK